MQHLYRSSLIPASAILSHVRSLAASTAPAFSAAAVSQPKTAAVAAASTFRIIADEGWEQRLFGLERPRGLLVDAAGTLISPSESLSEVYLRYGRAYGVRLSHQQVLENFRVAYNTPWKASYIRYVGDGREFWRHIVSESTGCNDEQLCEEIYSYYLQANAWKLTPGAVGALQRVRRAGIKIAVVSNFDTRLRPLLKAMGVSHLFDSICVSAEIGAEKPNPCIFEAALEELGLDAHEAIHVGDDRRNDIMGARAAGITAWLWNVDVSSFDEVADKVLSGSRYV